jgi:tetraacyldisaccharide 4'-kinase
LSSLASRLSAALQRAWWAPRPTALALALHPLSMLYALLAGLHRLLSWPRRVGLPVVVVGNLIVGGAGKTPTVMALARLLRAFGWTPGVISRGHGRVSRGVLEVSAESSAREVGDEPLLIHLRAAVPVVVGASRLAAAAALRRAHPEVDIVIADDGLQHHRLARDAEVLVFDDRGVGNGLRLPAGPLRQSLPLELTHQRLVLYNALEPSTPLPGWMAQRRLSGVLLLDDWARGAVATREGWAALLDRRVIAAAGIAAPERFFAALRDEGLEIEPLPLPDHFDFQHLPWSADSPTVIVTEKDAVKLRGRELGPTRVWVAPLDFDPDLGFAAAIKRLFPKPPDR